MFPVLLHVLMVPGIQLFFSASGAKRVARTWLPLTVAIILLVGEGTYFQFLFQRHAPERWYFMDARFARRVLDPALGLNRRPIYLYDPPNHSGYIQALWHGTLRGLGTSDFVRVSSPESIPADGVAISSERACTNCRLLARSLNYIVYVVLPSDLRVKGAPLPPEAFRAEVSLRQVPQVLQTGQATVLRTSVRNISSTSWPCIGDSGRYAVDVRARWRDESGTILADAGGAFFDYDLEPGDVNDSDLQVTAPAVPGNYLLEIDVVQEPDQWFAAKGSKPLLVPIRVN